MNVSIELTPKMLSYIRKKVKGGLYNSRSEVLRAALRMMIAEEAEDEEDVRELDAMMAEIKSGKARFVGEEQVTRKLRE
ncbi:Putative nickel-responsive regulator [Candidatus Burarchaeum australiense]|nr:Putative nickel-responsive regulator [Candidatus Burarchaeum australiense]